LAREDFFDATYLTRRLSALSKRAQEKGFGFDLDPQFLANLYLNMGDNCPCCREPFLMYGESRPSIDRLDSTRGYLKDNVAIICRECNTFKGAIEGSTISSKKTIYDAFFEEHFHILAFMHARAIPSDHIDVAGIPQTPTRVMSLKAIANLLSRCSLDQKIKVLSMASRSSAKNSVVGSW
jgi:hypothetical protein